MTEDIINVVIQDSDPIYVTFDSAIIPPEITEHIANEEIHITALERQTWNNKQDTFEEINLVEIFEGELA